MRHTTAPLAALAAVPLLLLGLAGCSEGSGADETDGPKSQSEIEKASKDWQLALTDCLRDAGLDIGDPEEGKGTALEPGDSNVDVATAMKKCQKQVTDELGERPVSDSEQQEMSEGVEQQRKLAACVRDKGYDMPDPKVTDGGAVSSQTVDVPEDVMESCQSEVGTGK